MANCLSDFPPGPLDKYRKLASFDWKQLSLFLNGEEFLNYQVNIMIILLHLDFLHFLNYNI